MVLESLMKFLTDKYGESAGFVRRGEREHSLAHLDTNCAQVAGSHP